MNTALPSGRRGQALAAALALVVLASLWIAVVDPLLGWYGDRAQALVQQRALDRRMVALVAMVPDLQRRAADEGREQTPADAVLSGASDAVAGAELLQHVQDMAASAGVTLTSVDTLAAQPQGAYRRIAVRVSLSAPFPVVVRLLQSVRQSTPRMLVDALTIESGRALVHPQGLPLDAGFTILAFRAGTAPP